MGTRGHILLIIKDSCFLLRTMEIKIIGEFIQWLITLALEDLGYQFMSLNVVSGYSQPTNTDPELLKASVTFEKSVLMDLGKNELTTISVKDYKKCIRNHIMNIQPS